jgi:hypothetical protein
VMQLDFTSPYKHLVVDIAVTIARASCSALVCSASLLLRDSLAVGAQHAKLD